MGICSAKSQRSTQKPLQIISQSNRQQSIDFGSVRNSIHRLASHDDQIVVMRKCSQQFEVPFKDDHIKQNSRQQEIRRPDSSDCANEKLIQNRMPPRQFQAPQTKSKYKKVTQPLSYKIQINNTLLSFDYEMLPMTQLNSTCSYKQLLCIQKISGAPRTIIKVPETSQVIPMMSQLNLQHMNLPFIYEIFELEEKYSIVHEYISGPTLKNLLEKNQVDKFSIQGWNLDEQKIAKIIFQILSLFSYLHQKKLFHGHLSASSFQLLNPDSDTIKLIDWQVLIDKPKLTKGQLYYLSPEETNKYNYTFERDVWAIGVIMYQLLSLSLPFKGDTMEEVQVKISQGLIDYNNLTTISDDALELLQDLLRVNYILRDDCKEHLSHPWFKKYINYGYEILNQRNVSKSQACFIEYIVRTQFPDIELQILSLFMQIDKNQNQVLEKQEIETYITENDFEDPNIIEDLRKQGPLTYSEFLIYLVNRKIIITEASIKKLFLDFSNQRNRIKTDSIKDKFGIPTNEFLKEDIMKNYKTVNIIYILVGLSSVLVIYVRVYLKNGYF